MPDEETIRREVVFHAAVLERVEAAIPEGGNRSQLVNDLCEEALDARERPATHTPARPAERPAAPTGRPPGQRQVWPPNR